MTERRKALEYIALTMGREEKHMEEIMEAEAITGTTPEAEAEGTGQPVDTTAESPAQAAAEDTTPAAAEQEETAHETAQQETEQHQTEEDAIAIRYNHEAIRVPLSDARRQLQHYRHITREGGVMDVLEQIADARGTDVESMVKSLAQTNDQMLKNQLLERAKGDQEIADQLYELEVTKRRAAHEAAKGRRAEETRAQEETASERMAKEFRDMKEDFGLDGMKDVPDAVLSMAVEENINLRDAYLRYQWAENKRKERNAAQQAQAAKASAGSQSGGVPEEPMDANAKAMLAGLRAALS